MARRAGVKLSEIRFATGEDARENAIPPPIPASNDGGFRLVKNSLSAKKPAFA
jgi:hypothetical protein